MNATELGATTPDTRPKLYLEFSLELYTSNLRNANAVTTAAIEAIRHLLQKINLPLNKCEMTTQKTHLNTYKTTIEAASDCQDTFPDFQQTDAWSDMVWREAKPIFTRRKLKDWLLIKGLGGYCSYGARQTGDSDLFGSTMFL